MAKLGVQQNKFFFSIVSTSWIALWKASNQRVKVEFRLEALPSKNNGCGRAKQYCCIFVDSLTFTLPVLLAALCVWLWLRLWLSWILPPICVKHPAVSPRQIRFNFFFLQNFSVCMCECIFRRRKPLNWSHAIISFLFLSVWCLWLRLMPVKFTEQWEPAASLPCVLL